MPIPFFVSGPANHFRRATLCLRDNAASGLRRSDPKESLPFRVGSGVFVGTPRSEEQTSTNAIALSHKSCWSHYNSALARDGDGGLAHGALLFRSALWDSPRLPPCPTPF